MQTYKWIFPFDGVAFRSILYNLIGFFQQCLAEFQLMEFNSTVYILISFNFIHCNWIPVGHYIPFCKNEFKLGTTFDSVQMTLIEFHPLQFNKLNSMCTKNVHWIQSTHMNHISWPGILFSTNKLNSFYFCLVEYHNWLNWISFCIMPMPSYIFILALNVILY